MKCSWQAYTQKFCLTTKFVDCLFSVTTMSWSTRPPEECYLHVNNWARNTFRNPAPTVPTHNFADKKDLSKILKGEVNNANDLIKVTSELYQIVQISRLAMKSYSEKIAATNLELQNSKKVLNQAEQELSESKDLNSSVSQMKSELIESMSTMIDTKLESLFPKQSYATIVDEGPIQHSPVSPSMIAPLSGPEVMVIGLPDENSSAKISREISENLKDVQVQFMKVNKDRKKIIVGFPNKFEKEKGIAANTKLSEENNCPIKSSEKMLPKLTVQNVSSEIFRGIDSNSSDHRDLQKERVVDLILKKNPGVKALVENGHTLKAVYLKSDNLLAKYYTIALQVSPAIRSNLINAQGGRLFIGNQCYPFSDRFHYKVCYHCQEIGHMSDKCPSSTKAPVCLYCSLDHKSKECLHKKDHTKHNCAPCSKSNVDKLVRNSHTHNAASPDCPVAQREIKRIQNNTEFLSKNVM